VLQSENPVPAFLATDDYVPGAFRDLLTEADGCMQKGFLTGGTACARRALDLLLNVAKTEGTSYEDRLQSLGEKHGVAKMLTSILVQCGGASAKDNATLSADVLQLFIVTMKAVVYELYVVGPERTNRLQYVSRLVTSVGRKPTGEAGAPGHEAGLDGDISADHEPGSSAASADMPLGNRSYRRMAAMSSTAR
jgi:hypothetical protein